MLTDYLLGSQYDFKLQIERLFKIFMHLHLFYNDFIYKDSLLAVPIVSL